MERKRRLTNSRGVVVMGLAALSATFSAACGSDHLGITPPGPDGGVDGAPADSAGVDTAKDQVGDRTPADGPVNVPVGAGSVLLVPGDAKLIGRGGDSCSRQVPATRDRWCAIARPSTFLGNSDLWVVNVSQAIAGQPVKCDGNDPSCIRLSTALFADDLTIHGFFGDTLIYYAENNGNQSFIGTVFAWRPEWSGPRALTSQLGLFCQGHPTALSALCIQNPVTNATTNQTTLDVVAGTLGATDTGPLPLVDTVLYAAMGDATNVNKVQFELSPAGDAVLWSSRATAAGKEILRSQTLNDASTKKVIATDAAQWHVTPDSHNWYWLSGFNYNTTGTASGTLQIAPYPAGTAPATLATAVGDYVSSGNHAVVLRTGLARGLGDLSVISDVANVAGTTKKLDSAVLQIWTVSQDGSTVMYSKTSDAAGQLVDMYFGSVNKTAPCQLASTAVAFGFGNLAEPSLTAAWVKVLDANNNTGAFATNLTTCASTKFATNILTLDAISDQGYVYLDDGSETGDQGTLRFNQIMAGAPAASGQVIQKQALPTAAVLWPAYAAVVYTIATGGSTDGLYINAKLPFTGAMPPPASTTPDAGAAAETGTDTTPPATDAGAETAAETGNVGDASSVEAASDADISG